MENQGALSEESQELKSKLDECVKDFFQGQKFIQNPSKLAFDTGKSKWIRNHMGIENLKKDGVVLNGGTSTKDYDGWWRSLAKKFREMHNNKKWSVIKAIQSNLISKSTNCLSSCDDHRCCL